MIDQSTAYNDAWGFNFDKDAPGFSVWKLLTGQFVPGRYPDELAEGDYDWRRLVSDDPCKDECVYKRAKHVTQYPPPTYSWWQYNCYDWAGWILSLCDLWGTPSPI